MLIMKINPFCTGVFDKYIVLEDQNHRVFLRFFPLDKDSEYTDISVRIKESRATQFNPWECFERHYRPTGNTLSCSVNFVVDLDKIPVNLSHVLSSIEQHALPYSTRALDPKHQYFSMFDGHDSFSFNIESNIVHLIDNHSKEYFHHLAFFEIKLHNMKHVDGFLSMMDDLSSKMGMQFDLFILMKRKNARVFAKGILVYKESNHFEFKNALGKMKDIREFTFVVAEMKVDARVLTSLLLRRWIGNGELAVLNDVHALLAGLIVPEVPDSRVSGDMDEPPLVMNEDLENDNETSNRFIKEIQAHFGDGEFLDDRTYTRKDVTYMLVSGLASASMRKTLNENLSQRLVLVFPRKADHLAFLSVFPERLNGIYQTMLLSSF